MFYVVIAFFEHYMLGSTALQTIGKFNKNVLTYLLVLWLQNFFLTFESARLCWVEQILAHLAFGLAIKYVLRLSLCMSYFSTLGSLLAFT